MTPYKTHRHPGLKLWTAVLCGFLSACGGTGDRTPAQNELATAPAPRLHQRVDVPMRPTVKIRIGKRRSSRAKVVESGIPAPLVAASQEPLPLPGRPRITNASRRLQCVPYARQRSGITIRGDAWTWWKSAQGRYQRGSLPAIGSILVLRRKGRSRGHLAYVTHVINDREIVADHANWLNNGRIHRNTPVRDVSANNDWSAVKVWHTPTRQYGITTRSAYGFIYPVNLRSSQLIRRQGSG